MQSQRKRTCPPCKGQTEDLSSFGGQNGLPRGRDPVRRRSTPLTWVKVIEPSIVPVRSGRRIGSRPTSQPVEARPKHVRDVHAWYAARLDGGQFDLRHSPAVLLLGVHPVDVTDFVPTLPTLHITNSPGYVVPPGDSRNVCKEMSLELARAPSG